MTKESTKNKLYNFTKVNIAYQTDQGRIKKYMSRGNISLVSDAILDEKLESIPIKVRFNKINSYLVGDLDKASTKKHIIVYPIIAQYLAQNEHILPNCQVYSFDHTLECLRELEITSDIVGVNFLVRYR